MIINLRFEIINNFGESWRNITSGSCGRYKDDIYCFGGFNCTNLKDNFTLWTRYNLKENLLVNLNSKNLENVIPREQCSVTCITEKKNCLIGAGQLLEGGTIDQWAYYNIEKDKFKVLNPKNKPTNIQYLSPDIAETWELENNPNGYKVINNGPILLTGGDNSSHALLSSDTIRYLAKFNYQGRIGFKEYPTDDLFTIKGQFLRNIPKFKNNDNRKENVDDLCDYFVEYGGKEQNPQVPFHYINQVVLYKICNR